MSPQGPLNQTTPTGNKNKNHHQKTNFSSSQHLNYITIRYYKQRSHSPLIPFLYNKKVNPFFPATHLLVIYIAILNTKLRR